MDKEQIKSEYEQLCKQAEQHNFNYYVLDDPTIEDDEYDRLMRRIKEIEAENPEIVSESFFYKLNYLFFSFSAL